MARLGGLATPRGPTDHHNALARHRAKELLAVFSHRQPLAQLLEPRINSSKWFSGSERGVFGVFSCVFGRFHAFFMRFRLSFRAHQRLCPVPAAAGAPGSCTAACRPPRGSSLAGRARPRLIQSRWHPFASASRAWQGPNLWAQQAPQHFRDYLATKTKAVALKGLDPGCSAGWQA